MTIIGFGVLGDYGDAPASYGDPFSDQQGVFRLGATVDLETSNPNDNSATDDDGATIPVLTQGQAATIPVTFLKAITFTSYINGWIDWNGDGDFLDPGEQIATNLGSTALSGTENINVTVPAGATTSQTYARFRISSPPGISATGIDTYGEVEDYALTINNSGSGSGPVCGISSDQLNNWTSGNLNYSEFNMDGSGVDMSVAVTGETAQITQIQGGSLNGINGLDLRTNGFFGAGSTFTYTFSTGISSVDFDIGHINASFMAGDNFVITAKDSLGNTVYPTFATSGASYTANPATGVVDAYDQTPENLGVHFENANLITQIIIVWNDCSTCNDSSHGAVIGEMEICVPTYDYSDAPLTGTTYGDAWHVIISGIQLGVSIDADSGSLSSANADGDDLDGVDDEDGVSAFPTLSQGVTTYTVPEANISLANTTGGNATLYGFIDFNGDGDFADIGETTSQTVANSATTPDGDVVFSGFSAVPSITSTFARFRLSTDIGLDATTLATNGEVEDYALTIIAGSTTLTVSKTVAIWDPASAGLYAVPGNDVIYTIMAANTGGSAADIDSIVLFDLIPSDITFYNGDIDDGGPETDPVSFSQTGGAGLTLTYATDVKYSNSVTKPVNFAACTYSPSAGYDSNVTYICFNPKGAMAAGDPDPTFSVSFRAGIN